METATRPEDTLPGDLHTPPLQNGDRLTRPEFERRYEAMPELKKAELIEGRVYLQTSVKLRSHGEPHAHVVGWLGVYCASTPGVDGADNSTVRLDWDNEPQPDALLLLEPERGGQTIVGECGFIEGAPELVVEVAASSASYDVHEKRHAYQRSGVREYVVWRVLDREIDWLLLRDGRYERQAPGEDGLLRSEVFPGLWLDPAALLAGDLARVLEVVRQGVATPDHAAFIGGAPPGR